MTVPAWLDQLISLVTLLGFLAAAAQVLVQKIKPLYQTKYAKYQSYIDECLSALLGIGLVALFQINVFAPFAALIPPGVPTYAGWIIGGVFVGLGSNFLQAILQALSYVHDLPASAPPKA